MKMVEMTRDVRPFHKGQNAVVDDELAARLVAEGNAVNARDFPPSQAPPMGALKRPLPPRSRTYLTKGA